MRNFTKEPEVIAAIISVVGTVVGTLLISIILGFLEGRIGLGPVVIIVAVLLLITILVLLFMFWGPRRAGLSVAAMVVIGSVIFLVGAMMGFIPEKITHSSPTKTIPAPTSPARAKATTSVAVEPTALPTDPPSATTTPAPTATNTLIVGEQFKDDFNNSAFDGRFNPALWSLQGVESVQMRQEGGVMTLATLSQDGWGAKEMFPLDPPSWTLEGFSRFQADLKLDGSRRGKGGLIKLQVIIPQARGDDWWIECQLKNSEPEHALYFCNYYSGGPWVWPDGYEYYTEMVKVPYDTWVTAWIEIEPQTARLSFYLDESLLGSHQVRDVDVFRTTDFYPLMGSWVEVGEDIAAAFDNVSIGP